jgi:hypothetical protein
MCGTTYCDYLLRGGQRGEGPDRRAEAGNTLLGRLTIMYLAHIFHTVIAPDLAHGLIAVTPAGYRARERGAPV